VSLVWVFDPPTRSISAHRVGREPRVFREDDVLHG
jgi:hypothetical protein